MGGIILETTFPVGKFMCTLTFSDKMTAAWEPCQPTVGDLTAQDMDAYRVARNKFIEQVGTKIGKRILVVDI